MSGKRLLTVVIEGPLADRAVIVGTISTLYRVAGNNGPENLSGRYTAK
jgi:hypothetical protein